MPSQSFLALLLALSQARAEPKVFRPDIRCGSYCLQVALGAQGLAPQDFEELETMVGEPGPGGYSMALLSEVAGKLGAQSTGVETTLENLRARTEPFACIALLGNHHFVLLYDSDQSNVFVVDPPRSYTVPIETFRGEWTGKALLVGPRPFLSEESVAGAINRRHAVLVGIVLLSALACCFLFALLLRRIFLVKSGAKLYPHEGAAQL